MGRFWLLPLVSGLTVAWLSLSLSRWQFTLLAFANLAGLCAFGMDKLAAVAGSRRTPEALLHTLSIVGVLGASLGRVVFRHKTLHPSFTASQLLGGALLLTAAFVMS